jgi:hypothetical protein
MDNAAANGFATTAKAVSIGGITSEAKAEIDAMTAQAATKIAAQKSEIPDLKAKIANAEMTSAANFGIVPSI